MAFKRLFDPKSSEPFRLSRTKIELSLRCPRCFYLDQRLGIKQPPSPPFSLNSAVDLLLKKEFDTHRSAGTAHPLMVNYGIKAVPLAHEKMNDWRHNFTGVQFLHRPTNFLVFGAVDDIWVNPAGEFIVVDYKATSKDEEVNLDADWQISYKRQMEIYQWLLRQNGYRVSPTGYFVYANGRRDLRAFDGRLEFNVKVMPYIGKDEWVGEALRKAREILISLDIPAPGAGCEFCVYRREAARYEVF